ncbi:MAG: DNA repair exonuclease [Clostridia bacterium]|nr:DNA repair exonuclease [Clostridia bacterium]
MPLKIVHCADLHIGVRSSLLGANSARRSAEVQNGLLSVTRHCREIGADVLLVAGDLFDIPCPGESETAFVKDCFASIPETQVFIAAGNHDYLTPSSPYTEQWSDNVHIFNKAECIELPDARIYGIPFCEPYEAAFSLPRAARDGKANILLVHGDIFGGPYNPLTAAALENTGMDYVALGHVHAYSGILYAGRVCYAYSGSVEPLGFDEIGEHGVISGTVSAAGANLGFTKLCGRMYREIAVNAGDFAVESELLRHLSELIAPYKNDMVKIILNGECAFSPDRERMLAALENEVFFLRIKNRTYPKENLELLRKEQTLKGFFTNKMLNKIETLSGDEREAAVAALRIGLAAFAGRGLTVDED